VIHFDDDPFDFLEWLLFMASGLLVTAWILRATL
jgi:hypothetical protein